MIKSKHFPKLRPWSDVLPKINIVISNSKMNFAIKATPMSWHFVQNWHVHFNSENELICHILGARMLFWYLEKAPFFQSYAHELALCPILARSFQIEKIRSYKSISKLKPPFGCFQIHPFSNTRPWADILSPICTFVSSIKNEDFENFFQAKIVFGVVASVIRNWYKRVSLKAHRKLKFEYSESKKKWYKSKH